jgi:hypothetical protein
MTHKSEVVTVTGQLPADLANAVSDAIHDALAKGMAIDGAVGVVIGVAADYGRAEYGDGYLSDLADLIMLRVGRPLPRSAP